MFTDADNLLDKVQKWFFQPFGDFGFTQHEHDGKILGRVGYVILIRQEFIELLFSHREEIQIVDIVTQFGLNLIGLMLSFGHQVV